MTEAPKPEAPEGDDAEFERVLRNLVNTPHKPHVKSSESEAAKKQDKGGGQFRANRRPV